MPSGKIQEKVMIKNNLYGREIESYTKVISSIENLLNEAGDDTKLVPRCLYTSYEPRPYLVFQDMTPKGYRALPRQKFITFDLALPVIVKLAKLHAGSAVLFDKEPMSMELYKEGSISTNPERQDFLVHYRNCAFTLGDVAEKEWGNEWKEIAEKLKKLSKKIIRCGQELYTRDESGFNVFNQNDLWTPNILYKIDENEVPQDILFVDFQMPYFSSPAIDLNFFLYGSLSESARISFMKKLIRIYHETLTETLKKLNYSKTIPTLHDIHLEMLKKGFQCVIASLAEVPLLLFQDDQGDLSMDKVLEDSDEAKKFRYKIFNNPTYKSHIQTLLIEFDDLGYLD